MAFPTSFNKQTLQPTGTPFNNIGLAFSGGGFRAASFTLGTLSYLNEVSWDDVTDEKLVHRVSYISSASGGTITNATYALSVASGRSFSEFYKHLFTQVEGLKLLDRVFEILNDDATWKKPGYRNKRRNLINAFSVAYDQSLFSWPDTTKGARLGALQNGNPAGHLDEVCFNTTEFYRGLLFRQAVKLKPDTESPDEFLYGNYIINIRNGAEQHFRMGDALAASSCFPAGFEPIVFPSDFINEEITVEEILRNTRIQPQEVNWGELDKIYEKSEVEGVLGSIGKPPEIEKLRDGLVAAQDAGKIKEGFETGFMDGGITDNQGIDSMMRANARREAGRRPADQKPGKPPTKFPPFDLMMTNDVGSHYMDAFTPLPYKRYHGIKSLGLTTVRMGSVVIAVFGVAFFITGVKMCNGWGIALAALGSVLAVVFSGIFAGIEYLRGFIKRKLQSSGLKLEKNFSEGIPDRFFRFFGGTQVGVLLDMIKERGASVLTLNSDVFLKRIRQLLYERILDEGRSCYRMKTNHVYDLAYTNDIIRLQNDSGDPTLAPNTIMQNVAQCAFEMGTTLWFSTLNKERKDYNQAALIATGHFTTCYNLLVFIDRMKQHPKDADKKPLPSFYDGLDATWQQKTDHLQAQMKQHYERFKEDPFWLYNELGERCGIRPFEKARIEDYKFPGKEFGGLREEK